MLLEHRFYKTQFEDGFNFTFNAKLCYKPTVNVIKLSQNLYKYNFICVVKWMYDVDIVGVVSSLLVVFLSTASFVGSLSTVHKYVLHLTYSDTVYLNAKYGDPSNAAILHVGRLDMLPSF